MFNVTARTRSAVIEREIIDESRFPEEDDDEVIDTKYSNGILEVRLPVKTGSYGQR